MCVIHSNEHFVYLIHMAFEALVGQMDIAGYIGQ